MLVITNFKGVFNMTIVKANLINEMNEVIKIIKNRVIEKTDANPKINFCPSTSSWAPESCELVLKECGSLVQDWRTCNYVKDDYEFYFALWSWDEHIDYCYDNNIPEFITLRGVNPYIHTIEQDEYLQVLNQITEFLSCKKELLTFEEYCTSRTQVQKEHTRSTIMDLKHGPYIAPRQSYYTVMKLDGNLKLDYARIVIPKSSPLYLDLQYLVYSKLIYRYMNVKSSEDRLPRLMRIEEELREAILKR